MKDIFKKISDFLESQIYPDERPGQAKKQEYNGIRQSVAQNQRKTAEYAEI
jgi:hypothetical protein